MDPGKYIDCMIEAYEQHFGVKPDIKHGSPLQKGDHPKLDTTPFLNEDDKEILIPYWMWIMEYIYRKI